MKLGQENSDTEKESNLEDEIQIGSVCFQRKKPGARN